MCVIFGSDEVFFQNRENGIYAVPLILIKL